MLEWTDQSSKGMTLDTATTDVHTSATLRVDDADLYYELRGHGPLVVLHAAPMDAASFAPAAALLARDRTVLSMDPRGIHRSRVDDRRADVDPDRRADDVAAVLDHLDLHASALFGSSGGAVSALALAQRRPDLVDTVVAHEPPLAQLVDDTEVLRADTERMVQAYLDGDRVRAWRMFMESADIDLPDEVFDHMFGGEPSEQEAADEWFSFANMEMATTFWTPDLPRLREGPVRIVVGIGQDSAGELCDRTSQALADELDLDPVMFPGGHVGFAQSPGDFADRLLDVLGPPER